MSDQEASDADVGLIGTTISGRYQIVQHLGSGGMGSVFKARQLAMNRMVALKLLHAHYASNKQAVARFNREMQVTARIEHPNTIRVYDFGQTDDGRIFLAMEFLEGQTLSKALSHGEPMGSERLVHIGTQIGKALMAAHSDGIVHRDLKPDNVMLLDRYGERDFVKVLDFGIARFMDDSGRTQLTAEGAVVGTPIYMSPEQATGGAMDHRTDLYSFGVMLFEMATGRVPFDAPTTISLMVKHVQEEPPRPSDFAPGLVPDAIETLILQMLAKNPAARPASAAEVVRQLEAAIAPVGVLAADTWVQTGLGDTKEGDAVDPGHTSTAQHPLDVTTRGAVGSAPPSRAPGKRGLWFALGG
ncbi:MAG: serine/threonine protein kinase, partial [Deltaproteobacteria bacterium]